jgi:hypothetical protein
MLKFCFQNEISSSFATHYQLPPLAPIPMNTDCIKSFFPIFKAARNIIINNPNNNVVNSFQAIAPYMGQKKGSFFTGVLLNYNTTLLLF